MATRIFQLVNSRAELFRDPLWIAAVKFYDTSHVVYGII